MNLRTSLLIILVSLGFSVPINNMEVDPADANITFGDQFLKEGDYIKAISLYKKAIQQDTNLAAKRTAQEKIDVLYTTDQQNLVPYLMGKAQQATDLTSKAQAALFLGENYKKHNEFEKAKPFLTYAEQQNFNQAAKAEARIIIAQIFLEKDEFQKAIPYLNAILEQSRANEYIKAAATGTLGLMYQLLNDDPQAIPFFQRAAEQNTNHLARLASLGQLGQIYFRNKEYQKALPLLEQVAQQTEAPFLQAEALYWLGAWYVEQNEYTHAIEKLTLVTKQDINPKARASALLLLGRISMRLQNHHAALSYFEQAASQQDHITVQKIALEEIDRIHGAQTLDALEHIIHDSKRERELEGVPVLERALEAALKKIKEEGQ